MDQIIRIVFIWNAILTECSNSQIGEVRNDNEYFARESLAKCVLEGSQIFFDSGEVLNIALPSEQVDKSQLSTTVLNRLMLSKFHNQIKWPIVIKKTKQLPLDYDLLQVKKHGNYIIQIRNIENITNHIKFLQLQPSWNPHGRFIIIGLLPNEDQTFSSELSANISKIVQAFWKFNILNAVILLPVAEDSAVFNIFSWFPYENRSCGSLDLVANNVKIIDTCTMGQFNTEINWFPKKIPKYLDKCPLNVRTFVHPPFVMGAKKINGTKDSYEIDDGFDVRLIELLSLVLNITPSYSMSGNADDWGFLSIKNGGTGILGALVRNEYHVGIGSLSASVDRHAALDSSRSYLQEALSFCVPHSDEKPQWKKIVQILKLDVWMITITFGLVLTYLIYWQSLREPEELNMYKSFGGILQRMLSIVLYSTISKQPRTSKVRYLLIHWILLCLILDTAYQTYLTSVLTTTDYEPQIKTVGDILDSDLTILNTKAADRFYHRSTSSQSTQILARLENCADLDDCLTRTALIRDSVVISPRLYTKYAINKFVRKDGRPLLYCFDDNIVSFPVVLYFQKGYPLICRVVDVVDRIVSAGYLDYWTHDIFRMKIKNPFLEAMDTDNDSAALNLDQLQIAFIILLVGICLGVLAFLLEIFVHRIVCKYFM